MSTPEENIKTILSDWLDALRRHDLAKVERRMAPEVFWQGVREDFICENRDEAMEMLREQQHEEHGVEALELIATEEKVVLGCEAPSYRRSEVCHLVARSSRSSRCAITTAGSSE
jgi:ketosteroid isomerase-like protein